MIEGSTNGKTMSFDVRSVVVGQISENYVMVCNLTKSMYSIYCDLPLEVPFELSLKFA